jgi:RNA polymerase sigma factor (sigma-70 family)
MTCKISGCTQPTFHGAELCYFHRKQKVGLLPKDDRLHYLTTKDLKVVGKQDQLNRQQTELFDCFLPLARDVAKRFASRYTSGLLDFDDYFQMCAIKLWQLILFNELDLSKNARAYVIKSYISECVDFTKEHFEKTGMNVCLFTNLPGEDLEECIIISARNIELQRVVETILVRASELERCIFFHHLYPADHEPWAIRRIAKVCGESRMTTWRTRQKLIRKLREKLALYGDLNYWRM